jgi:hypothetical protein
MAVIGALNHSALRRLQQTMLLLSEHKKKVSSIQITLIGVFTFAIVSTGRGMHSLIIRYLLLIIGHSFLISGHSFLIIGYSLLIIER